MGTVIQVLDYGSGNLFSIENALRGASDSINVKVSSRFESGKVDALVLPGVGSFSSAQEILSENKAEILEEVGSNKLPLLGICLGMQLLFEKSKEGPGEGLSIFKGGVERFTKPKNGTLKIPHMGWNTVEVGSKSKFCSGLAPTEWAYFVHSYFPLPKDKAIVRAWTSYGRRRFASIVEQGNVFGTQFHPEKSQAFGRKLISNFARLAEARAKK